MSAGFTWINVTTMPGYFQYRLILGFFYSDGFAGFHLAHDRFLDHSDSDPFRTGFYDQDAIIHLDDFCHNPTLGQDLIIDFQIRQHALCILMIFLLLAE